MVLQAKALSVERLQIRKLEVYIQATEVTRPDFSTPYHM